MLFVECALVEDLDSEQTLLELACRIESVLLRLLGDDLELAINDAVRVNHALVGVFRLVDDSSELLVQLCLLHIILLYILLISALRILVVRVFSLLLPADFFDIDLLRIIQEDCVAEAQVLGVISIELICFISTCSTLSRLLLAQKDTLLCLLFAPWTHSWVIVIGIRR